MQAQLSVVVHAFNPRLRWQRQADLCELDSQPCLHREFQVHQGGPAENNIKNKMAATLRRLRQEDSLSSGVPD